MASDLLLEQIAADRPFSLYDVLACDAMERLAGVAAENDSDWSFVTESGVRPVVYFEEGESQRLSWFHDSRDPDWHVLASFLRAELYGAGDSSPYSEGRPEVAEWVVLTLRLSDCFGSSYSLSRKESGMVYYAEIHNDASHGRQDRVDEYEDIRQPYPDGLKGEFRVYVPGHVEVPSIAAATVWEFPNNGQRLTRVNSDKPAERSTIGGAYQAAQARPTGRLVLAPQQAVEIASLVIPLETDVEATFASQTTQAARQL